MKTLQEAIEQQEKYYSVIIDGNSHHLPQPIATRKETVSLAKCKEIVQKVEAAFRIQIKRIDIYMTQYDYNISEEDFRSAQYGDFCIQTIGPQKKAVYYIEKNRLQIWEDELPVYENDNGTITTDPDALADTYC